MNSRVNKNRKLSQFSIMWLLSLMTAVFVSLLIWSMFKAIGPIFLVFLWAALHLFVIAVFAVSLFKRYSISIAEWVSAIVSLIPLVSLIFVIRIFVVGGSSNVAQFAGGSGANLWSLWFNVFVWVLLVNFVACLIVVGCLFFRSYPTRFWSSFSMRVACLITAVIAVYFALTHIPDA